MVSVTNVHPYPRGTENHAKMKGRGIYAPGDGITLSELLHMLKEEGIAFLNSVSISGSIKWERPETADEVADRIRRQKEHDEYTRQGRYKAYLKMKEEFEPEGLD
jgi:hypothetical protein